MANPLPWKEVASNPEFRALSLEEQTALRDNYFARFIAPEFGKEHAVAVYEQFTNFADQLDQEYAASIKTEEPKEAGGLIGGTVSAIGSGIGNVSRAARATGSALLGDNANIEQIAADNTEANKERPLEAEQFMQEYQRRIAESKQDDGEVGVLEAIGDFAAAAWNNKTGAIQSMAEQLPNSAPVLAAGWAGAKAGAMGGGAAGSVVPGVGTGIGAAAGGIVGAFTGMFLGNAMLETGFKAMEKADGGLTDEERQAAIAEGSVKGAVIAGVDLATLGLGSVAMKAIGKSAIKAGAMAEAKTLLDAGVDITQPAVVAGALGSAELRAAAKAAGEAAAKAEITAGAKAAKAGAGIGLETVGEGVGEYAGEYAATGNGDVADAVMESMMGMGQSTIETAYNYNRSSGNDLDVRGIVDAGRSGLLSSPEQVAGVVTSQETGDAARAAAAAIVEKAAVVDADSAELLDNYDQAVEQFAGRDVAATPTGMVSAALNPQQAASGEPLIVPDDQSKNSFLLREQARARVKQGTATEADLELADMSDESLGIQPVQIDLSRGGSYASSQATTGTAATSPGVEQPATPIQALPSPAAPAGNGVMSVDSTGNVSPQTFDQAGSGQAARAAAVEASVSVPSRVSVRVQETATGAPAVSITEYGTANAPQIREEFKAAGIRLAKNKDGMLVAPKSVPVAQLQTVAESINAKFSPVRSEEESGIDIAEPIADPLAGDVDPNSMAVASAAEFAPYGVEAKQPAAPGEIPQSQSPAAAPVVQSEAPAPAGISAPNDQQAVEEALSKSGIDAGKVTIHSTNDLASESDVVGTARMSKWRGKTIERIAKMFGKKAVFYSSEKETHVDGMDIGSGDTVYVNINSGVDPLAVVGHEWRHTLKRTNAAAHEAINKAAKNILQKNQKVFAEFAQSYLGSQSDEQSSAMLARAKEGKATEEDMNFLAEEFSADMTGNLWRDPEALRQVFDEIIDSYPASTARSMIKAIGDALISLINKLLGTRSGFHEFGLTAEEMRDMKGEIQSAMKQAFIEVDRQRMSGQHTKLARGETRLSAKRANSEAGEFKTHKYKDGSILVYGDAAEIRAKLPEGVVGRVVDEGLRFTHSDAPRVIASLSGEKLAYSRAGTITDRKAMKDGKYVGAPEKFNTPGKIPHLRKWLRQLADEGAPGRFWYENSSREILRMTGGDVQEARKFVALLAIYSPQAKVDANSTFALRAWAQYKAGQPISVKTGVMDSKAQNALDDVDAFWSGEKTGNFFNNLLRIIDPSTAGRQGATIDMWMMRAGQYSTDAPTATQYAFMEDENNRLAEELGWEPQQVQAAIWVAMKARMENKGVKKATEATSEKRKWITFQTSAKGKKERVILDAQKHRDNWLKHAFEHDPSTDDTQAAKFDFSDGVLRHIGQISFEARPGRSTGVLPGIHDAPYAQQVEYQQAIQKTFYDEEGNDLIAMKLGLLVDGEVIAPGSWQGDVSPSNQKSVAMAPAKGEDGKSNVDPAQRELLNAYASLLGLLTKQEGVGWHRPFYSSNKSGENGVRLDIGRPLSPEEMKSLTANVDGYMKDKGIPDWENSFALISEPKGVRLINFGAVPNKEVIAIAEAAKTGLPDAKGITFTSDGDMPSNNWKENPDGQDYLARIREAGRSDLLGWSRDVLAPRIQRVNEEFSSKYGWGDAGQVKLSTRRPDGSGSSIGRASVAGRDQQGQQKGVSATGVHYSSGKRERLYSFMFGTGLKGAELERVNEAKDERLKHRIYFYVNTGKGINPEAGVGAHAHKADLSGLYDLSADPDGLAVGADQNTLESRVIDAGYEGIISQDYGIAWLLGKRELPVEYIGSGIKPDVPQAAQAKANDALAQQRAVASNKALPAGQMSGADWKRMMKALMPEIDVSHLDDGRDYYRSEIVKREAPKFSAARQTETEEFKRWFGDSKVVDADGKPLVVYHGTKGSWLSQLPIFRTDADHELGAHFGTASAANVFASQRGGKVAPVYLAIKNPLEMQADIGTWAEPTEWQYYLKQWEQGQGGQLERDGYLTDEIIDGLTSAQAVKEFLISRGFDGITYENRVEGDIDANGGSGEVSYIAFYPEQIKSAIGNNGQFDQSNPDIRFSARRSPFYSQLEKQVNAAPDRFFTTGKATAAWLQANQDKLGVKKDELHWTGVLDWLNTQGKITKADVSAYLAQGGVKVEEVMLGGDPISPSIRREFTRAGYDLTWDSPTDGFAIYDRSGEWVPERDLPADLRAILNEAEEDVRGDSEAAPKFATYALPGGENYRELLLTLPPSTDLPDGFALVEKREGYWIVSGPGPMEENQYGSGATKEQALQAFAAYGHGRDKVFKSSHYDQPNILAHVRFDERMSADGGRILFLQEVQSDFGQTGKKKGFARKLTAQEQSRLEDLRAKANDLRGEMVRQAKAENDAKYNEVDAQRDEVLAEISKLESATQGVPSAPFVTDTKSWTALALKRMIAYSVENGFDALAWTTGEQQAARYDLSKQISGVEAFRTTTDNEGNGVFALKARDLSGNVISEGTYFARELEGVVGKELAEKISSQPERMKTYSGLDLKVGGEGMRGYYDGILPQVANDILKKIGGGKVSSVKFDAKGRDAGNGWGSTGEDVTGYEAMSQPGFAITDAMREKVQNEGLPLFSYRRGQSAALDADADAWAATVDAHQKKTLNRRTNHMLLSSTPASMQVIGMQDRPVFVKGMHALDHIGERISAEAMKSLPYEIADPALVFYHEGDDGKPSLNFVTALKSNGKHVVVAMHPNFDLPNTGRAHYLATVMDKEDFRINAAVRAGNTVYVGDLDAVKGMKAAFFEAKKNNGRAAVKVRELASKRFSLLPTVDNSIKYKSAAVKMIESGQAKFSPARQTESPEFKAWSNGAPVVSIDEAADYFFRTGEPVVAQLLHGTTGDFAAFDRSRANPQSDMGAGFYFSNNTDDVGNNYAGEGEDLTNKIERTTERIQNYLEDSDEADGMTDEQIREEAERRARRELAVQHGGMSMPVFVKFSNPLVIGGNQDGFFDLTEEYNEELDEYAEPEGKLVDFVEALRDVAANYEGGDVEPAIVRIFEIASDNEGIYAADLVEALKSAEEFNYFMDDNGDMVSSDIMRQAFERLGYDGIIDKTVNSKFGRRVIKGAYGSTKVDGMKGMNPDTIHFIAFNPTQIKSAIGNSGAFDPSNPDIRFAFTRGPVSQASWGMIDDTKFDSFLSKYQDKFVDLKRIIQLIETSGKKIAADANAYLQEELFHGRASERVKLFVANELKPIQREMKLRGVTEERLQQFLHARHAKEANAHFAKINPNEPSLQDGGSGMTNKEADDFMNGLDPAERKRLEAVAAKVDSVIKGTRDELVKDQLISQSQADAWEKMFQHYVPLHREDYDGKGIGVGQGFSIKGKEAKHRTGARTLEVSNILANVIMEREKAIARGEKNRVAQALMKLAKDNPNPDFWEFGALFDRRYNEASGKVEVRVNSMWKQLDNVVTAKVLDHNGNIIERGLVFNENNERAMRLALALKNLDGVQLGQLLTVMGKFSRWFASVNTQWNPIFGVTNLIRDMQGMALNLGSTKLAGHKAEVMKHIPQAIIGIYQDLRAVRKGTGKKNQWSDLWEEMATEGGMTGYRDLYKSVSDRADTIASELDPYRWHESKLGKVFTANGTLKLPWKLAQKSAGWVFDWLSDFNETIEGATRLAAYKVARDNGISKQEAASISKNITVNFNRKGTVTAQAGAMYAFFNAAVQGTARIGETMFDMQNGDVKTIRLSKAGKAIFAGGVTVGVLQTLMLAAAGFDDDDDPKEFVRERNFIIPTGWITGRKDYLAIPMPLGYHVLTNLGRIPTEMAVYGTDNAHERMLDLLGIVADAFNPMGSAGISMQTLAPSMFDPLVALAENKDWAGRKIYQEKFNPNDPTPGFERSRDTSTWLSMTLAKGINWASGGDEDVGGLISPTADQLDYLGAQFGGGVYRELSKAEQTATSLITGEELPTYKIPLAGKFYGNAEGQSSQAGKFYENLSKMAELKARIEGRKERGESVSEFMKEHPESRLITMVSATDREIKKLRKKKRELIEQGVSKDRIRLIENQITTKMTRLNEAVDRLD